MGDDGHRPAVDTAHPGPHAVRGQGVRGGVGEQAVLAPASRVEQDRQAVGDRQLFRPAAGVVTALDGGDRGLDRCGAVGPGTAPGEGIGAVGRQRWRAGHLGVRCGHAGSPLARISSWISSAPYEWLCVRRQRYAPNNDVWTCAGAGPQVKAQVQTLLLTGQYRFDAMDMIPESEDQVALWTSRDALVLKALAIVLTRHLAPLLPKSCCHVINNGGSKAAVRLVASRLRGQRFVFRTDVKWYYSSVDHDILMAQLQQYIAEEGGAGLIAPIHAPPHL